MCVHACVCVRVRLRVRVRARAHAWVCGRACVVSVSERVFACVLCFRVFARVRVCWFVYVRDVCACMCVCARVCVYVCVWLCAYVSVYA